MISIQITFERLIVFLRQHLLNNSSKSAYIYSVLNSEENSILPAGIEIFRKHYFLNNLSYNLKIAGLTYLKEHCDVKRSAKKGPCIEEDAYINIK